MVISLNLSFFIYKENVYSITVALQTSVKTVYLKVFCKLKSAIKSHRGIVVVVFAAVCASTTMPLMFAPSSTDTIKNTE